MATTAPRAASAETDIGRKPALPPGPRMPWPLQSYLTYQRMVWWQGRVQRRYGDVVTVNIPPWGKTVIVADPKLVKEMVTGPPDVFQAGASNKQVLEPVLGSKGLLVIDEDEHLETRRRMLPPFHGEAVRAYEDVIREVTRQRVARWPLGVPIKMHRESRAITMEVILRAVFGAEDSASLPELRRMLRRMTHITLTISLWYVVPQLGLVPPWRGYEAAIHRANELIDSLIDERIADSDLESRDDILSMLIRSGETDRGWLRDQVMNLLAAGHETTTTGISWAVELLARHPDIRAKAREGDDEYLDAIVTETLRVRPVVPGVSRRLAVDARLGEHYLPAGTTLIGNISLMHHDPRLYDEPEEFRPERWLHERPGTYTWFPFGGGRRRCIGAAFAQLEMRVALRTILDMTDFEPARAKPEKQRNFHITLIPARGAQIIRTRLRAAGSRTPATGRR